MTRHDQRSVDTAQFFPFFLERRGTTTPLDFSGSRDATSTFSPLFCSFRVEQFQGKTGLLHELPPKSVVCFLLFLGMCLGRFDQGILLEKWLIKCTLTFDNFSFLKGFQVFKQVFSL